MLTLEAHSILTVDGSLTVGYDGVNRKSADSSREGEEYGV